jgi:hypothetical protein
MERVLKILLEVENLTVDERAQVKDGLVFIQPDVTEISSSKAPDSETFSNLAALINVRYKHQSEEEASAVRVARAQTGSYRDQDNAGDQPHSDLEQEDTQVRCEPHRPPAASQDSERRQLAKKINDILKANMEVSGAGKSTGLNRRARWNMEKLAAGSTLPAGGAVTATGNTANSQAVAQKTAQVVRFFFTIAAVSSFCMLNLSGHSLPHRL